jgi:hypothetical protein
VKRINFLAVVVAALSLILSGCGTSDYVQSVSVSATTSSVGGGLYNIYGWGGTLQLVVSANYHSGKSVPVTNSVVYKVTPQGTDWEGTTLEAPPNTVTISTTGMMTAVDPPVCTWVNENPKGTTASWFLSGSYQVIATYNGMASQPIFVGVSSAAGSPNQSTPGACGPTPTA